MERDVDETMAIGLGVIIPHDVAQALAFLLHGKGQDERIAPECRGARRRREIVGHDNAGSGRLRDMHMAVDAAGQDKLAGRVNDVRGGAKIVAKGGYLAAGDADIAGEGIRCGCNRAAADNRVERHDQRSTSTFNYVIGHSGGIVWTAFETCRLKLMTASRPPLPPFTAETAAQKARMAEDAWNTREPARVALA